VNGWVTLREIDRQAGQAKGTAFRAFKRAAPGWREDADYRALDPQRDHAEIEALRAAGRIYASSRAVVLLSPAAARAVLAAIGGAAPENSIASPGSGE
jgi:hypothetical protein